MVLRNSVKAPSKAGRPRYGAATATQRVRTGAVVGHTIKKDRPALTTRSVTRRNAAGHDLGSVDLEPTIFGLEPKGPFCTRW